MISLPDLSFFAAQTGYSPQMLRWGFDRMLAHWHREGVESFFAQEYPELSPEGVAEALSPQTTFEARRRLFAKPMFKSMLLVTASTVPSAAFQDVFLSLLLPMRITHRPAQNQHALFQALHASLSRAFPELASRWTIVAPDHDDAHTAALIESHDVLNVSGSDATINHFRSLAGRAKQPPFIIAHGHRLSAVAMFRHDIPELEDRDFDDLALDASVWDQTGCLSPKIIFFEGSAQDAEFFAQRLIESLDKVALELPEFAPESTQLAAVNSACLMAQFDGARIFKAHRNHDVIVLHSGLDAFRPVLLPRTLNLCPVNHALDATMRLAPNGQALASRSPLAKDDEIRMRTQAGFNYFPRFGKMQDPPLTWLHDDIGTIKPLFPKEMI